MPSPRAAPLSTLFGGGSAATISGEPAPLGSAEGPERAGVWWVEDWKTRAKKSLVSGLQRMENIAGNVPQIFGCLTDPQTNIFLPLFL